MKRFIKSPCSYCGRLISNCGFAYTKHEKADRKRGYKKGYRGVRCWAYVKSSGKCKIKIPTRYNDYCEEDDCPKNKPTNWTKKEATE